MGSSCSKAYRDVTIPNPKDPSLAKCSDDMDDFIGMSETHMCYGGTEDTELMESFCTSVGSGEEWVRKTNNVGSGCCTTFSLGPSKFRGIELNLNEFGHCIGHCDGGQSATTALTRNGECKRVKFSANPEVCCFLDYDCNKNLDMCFQTGARQRTCDPKYRNMSGPDCLEKIKPYCTGEKLFAGQQNWWDLWVENAEVDINSDETREFKRGYSKFIPAGYETPKRKDFPRFMKQPCMTALARAISRDSQFCTWEDLKTIEFRRGNFDPEGLKWAQEVINAIFDRYINEFGSFVGEINTVGKQVDGMEDVFFEICQKFPILCQNSLKRICQNVRADDLTQSNFARANIWCGCYMPDSEYEKYIDRYQINKECTPFCNTDNAIPLSDPDGFEIKCLQDICIIDNLRLNFIRNRIKEGGDINFNLLCGGCGGANVQKFISDGEDFNAERSNIVGFFSQTILDKDVCRVIAKDNPYNELFPNGADTNKTVMTGENNNDITVEIELITQGIGNDSGFYEFSIGFVSSEIINEEWKFRNGERLTFKNYETPCPIYALTISTKFSGDTGKSTRFLFRNKETAGSQCSCFFENSSLNIVDSELGGDLNLTLNCGYSECTNDKNEPIPCASNDIDSDYPDYFSPEEAIDLTKKNMKKKSITLAYTIMAFVLLVMLLIGIGILFAPTKTETPKKTN